MALKFKAWGLDGSLTSFTNFPTWNGNGVQQATASLDPAIRGDRADVVQIGGSAALRIRRHAGDPIAGFGKRTELVPNDFAQIANWTGWAGFNANETTRWYRISFMIPSTTDLGGYGRLNGYWAIVSQIHQVEDTTPADTQGNPTMAIECDANSIWIRRNRDADPTSTVFNADVHQELLSLWPMQRDVWFDVVIQVKWSWTTLGFLKMWLNDRLIFSETGVANTPNNHPDRGGGGNYLKMGIYHGLDKEFEVYHRGAIIGDYQSTWAEMHPENPASLELPMLSHAGGSLPFST